MTDVRKMIEDISDLPTLPTVVGKLNTMITDPNTSAADINEVISKDMSLSAKILKLVNSPFYGFTRKITTITYAVVILGFNTVRNLALSAFVFDTFSVKRPTGFDLNAFWKHSILVAMAAQEVAKATKPDLEEDAFMTGLLHDVGKVLMNQYLMEDLCKIMDTAKEKDCLFYDAETLAVGYNHCELGGMLLEKWNLPEKMVQSVGCLYRPMEATDEAKSLCAIIHVANIFVRALQMGNPGDNRIPCLDEEAWQQLGLDKEKAMHILRQVNAHTEAAEAFLALA